MSNRQLNEHQARAVACTDPRILCLAAAGSGKTETLTRRILRILSEGVRPDAILGITFTNRAADEMRARLALQIGEPAARRVQLYTFHAWAASLVRRFPEAVRRTRTFTIYDEEDRTDVLRAIAEQLGVKTGAKKLPGLQKALRKAEKADIAARLYEATLTRHNAMDFDGLLEALAQLLADPQIKRLVVDPLEHVLVDEYQDTSRFQAHLLHQVRDLFEALDPPSLFMVGDPMQSIYGFRGADVDGILEASVNPEVTTIDLPTNYRSVGPVIALGNTIALAGRSPLADVQPGRADAEGWSHCIDVQRHGDDAAGAEVIAGEIADAVREGDPPEDFMVLSRTWARLVPIADELDRHGIRYTLPRQDVAVWASEEMRWIVAGLRLVTNHSDALAIRRFCAWPTPIADDQEVHRLADSGGLRAVMDAEPHMPYRLGPLLGLGFPEPGEDPAAETDVREVAWPLIDVAREELRAEGLLKRLEKLREAWQAIVTWACRREERRAGVAVEHFLWWSNLREVGDWRSRPGPTGVQLLTIHAAKGIEAPVVHVVGMEGGVFPRSTKVGPALDEERRLFYVAVTRARDRLVLHSSERIYRYGRMVPVDPSPFLRLACGLAPQTPQAP